MADIVDLHAEDDGFAPEDAEGVCAAVPWTATTCAAQPVQQGERAGWNGFQGRENKAAGRLCLTCPAAWVVCCCTDVATAAVKAAASKRKGRGFGGAKTTGTFETVASDEKGPGPQRCT
jgi:hypothetical protein